MADKKITDLSALATPAIDDVLPIVDISANETKKIEVQNLNNLKQVSITLTNSQIKNLASVPVELIPAESGKIIVPLMVYLKLTAGTEALDDSGASIWLDWDNGFNYLNLQPDNNSLLSQSVNSFDIFSQSAATGNTFGPVASANCINKRIIISNSGSDVSGNASNDATLEIIITYTIV